MATNLPYRRSAVGALCLVAMSAMPGAQAAELPSQFLGVWLYADGSDKACKKSDWNNDARNDAHINVTARMIEFYESRCRYTTIKVIAGLNDTVLQMSCSGEGMTWRETNIWHLHKVGSKTVLVRVNAARNAVDLYQQCP